MTVERTEREPRVPGQTYPCLNCEEPYQARRENHYFCTRRPNGKACRVEHWQKMHPRVSRQPKPQPPWRGKRREYYTTDEIDEALGAAAVATGEPKSEIVRRALGAYLRLPA